MAPKMVPKWSQNGSQIRPMTRQGRSKSAPEKVSKNDFKIGAKKEPQLTPDGTQNRSKKGSRNEVGAGRAPRASQDRFWDDFGSYFNALLVHFGVSLLRFSCANRRFPMCVVTIRLYVFSYFLQGLFCFIFLPYAFLQTVKHER